MVVSKRTLNEVRSWKHKWNINFRTHTHTHSQRKKHFVALKHVVIYVTMSNSKVHPINLLLSSLLCHPIFWSFSFNHLFFSPLFKLWHPVLLTSTRTSCDPLSFSCLHSLYALCSAHEPPCHYILQPQPTIIQCPKIMLQTVYYSIEAFYQHCTVVALCCTVDKQVRHPAFLNTPVI